MSVQPQPKPTGLLKLDAPWSTGSWTPRALRAAADGRYRIIDKIPGPQESKADWLPTAKLEEHWLHLTGPMPRFSLGMCPPVCQKLRRGGQRRAGWRRIDWSRCTSYAIAVDTLTNCPAASSVAGSAGRWHVYEWPKECRHTQSQESPGFGYRCSWSCLFPLVTLLLGWYLKGYHVIAQTHRRWRDPREE